MPEPVKRISSDQILKNLDARIQGAAKENAAQAQTILALQAAVADLTKQRDAALAQIPAPQYVKTQAELDAEAAYAAKYGLAPAAEAKATA